MNRALVTGGSGTIGCAIAGPSRRQGIMSMCMPMGGSERAEEIAAEIVAAGGTAEAVRFDITDAAETARAGSGFWPPGRSRFWSTMPASMTTR